MLSSTFICSLPARPSRNEYFSLEFGLSRVASFVVMTLGPRPCSIKGEIVIPSFPGGYYRFSLGPFHTFTVTEGVCWLPLTANTLLFPPFFPPVHPCSPPITSAIGPCPSDAALPVVSFRANSANGQRLLFYSWAVRDPRLSIPCHPTGLRKFLSLLIGTKSLLSLSPFPIREKNFKSMVAQ